MKNPARPASADPANDDGPSARSAAPVPEAAPRRRSHLAAALDAHLAASPDVLSHGTDPRIQAAASALGLVALGVVARRASLSGRGVTVVAVPAHVWADPRHRADALRLKPLGRELGRRVVLVQEGPLLRQPRLGNARLVARCADAELGPDDRFAVIGSLIDEPGTSLGDLAGLLQGSAVDPVGAVLSLVAQGLVEVDKRRPIGPATPAWLHPDRARDAR